MKWSKSHTYGTHDHTQILNITPNKPRQHAFSTVYATSHSALHHLIDGIHRKAPLYKKTIQFRFPTNTVSCLSSSETLTKTQAKTKQSIKTWNLNIKIIPRIERILVVYTSNQNKCSECHKTKLDFSPHVLLQPQTRLPSSQNRLLLPLAQLCPLTEPVVTRLPGFHSLQFFTTHMQCFQKKKQKNSHCYAISQLSASSK